MLSEAFWALAARWAAPLVALLLLLCASAPAHAAGPLFAPNAGRPFDSSAALKLTRAAAVAPGLPDGFTESTVWSGLVAPTAFRFAPDGRVFVALKSGMIDEFDSIDDPTPTVYADLRTQVADFWDRGLLGLAIDPKFDEGRPYLYVAYTYNKDPSSPTFPRWADDNCPTPPGANGDGCVVSGRLSRLDPDGTEHVLIEDWCQQYPTHSIGTVQFGPDGALYVGAGDGASYTFADYGQDGSPVNPCGDPPGSAGSALTPPTAEGGALRSQSFRRAPSRPVSLDGAILRVDPDTGAALSDNPNANDTNANRRRIVAYGFRNPYRFVFRPGTNEIWAGDVGWDTWEEIDRIVDPVGGPTKNYGWPCYEGDGVMGAYHALGVNSCESLYDQGENAVVDPYFVYQHGTQITDADGSCGFYSSSITGLTFYSGGNFPAAYQNALFFTDYSRGCIWWMPAGDDGLPDPNRVRVFETGSAGPVYLAQGPDGALWYADLEGGTIRRIAFPGGNGAPNAVADADRTTGSTPLTVHFDGTESSDPDAGALTYSWDLDGDGAFGDSTSATPQYTYSHPGRYLVQLRVTDPGGLTNTTSLTVIAGDPPTATIESPDADLTWAVGDTIAFSGSARDAEGHEIPPSGLSWQVNIRHCSRFQEGSCHTHIAQTMAGVASGTFVAPDHDWPSHLELVLTATDSSGLTATQRVEIYPQTVDVTFESSPSGAQLSYGSYTVTTPATMTFIKSSQSTLTAATPQTIGGRDYDFASWSDGGSRTRTVAPAADTTYTASFVPSTSSTLAGASAVGTNVSQAPPGAGEVYRITAASSGSATKLRFYVDQGSTATQLQLGLYADVAGQPGTLLGAGSATSVIPGAWNEVSLPANVPVAAGQAYWFGLLNPLTSGGVLAWRDHAGGSDGAEQTSLDRALTDLPATWSTLASYSDGPVSGYVVGSTAAPEPPELAVSPAALSFGATENGASPAEKTLSIANAGTGTLVFTASTDQPWLSATPTSGTAPKTISVKADTSGLSAGTYTGHVKIGAGTASGSPASVPVTVTVSPPAVPVLSASPTSLAFTGVAGGEAPGSKTVAVANTGGGTLLFTASDDQPWLSVTPSSASAPASLTVAIDPTGLAAGTYTGNVKIDAGGISGSPTTIPVTLILTTAPPPGTETLGGATVVGTNVSSAPPGAGEAYRITGAATGTATRLRVYADGGSTATRLILGLYADASGNPSSLLGSGSITTVAKGTWNEVTLTAPVAITAGAPYWLAVLNPTGSGGTLMWRDRAGGSGGAEQTSAGRNLSALPATWSKLGSYTDGPISGYVVGSTAGPALTLSSTSLSFSGQQGGAGPAVQTFDILNAGGGTLNYSASDDASWLSVTPVNGSAPQTVTVRADTSGLSPGSFTGHVSVAASGASGSPATVTVTLTVTPSPPAILAVSPGSLSFEASADAAKPAGKTLTITNTGSGTLAFTASTDASWVSVTPGSGTAPRDLTVATDATGLAPGTYTAHVTVDGGGISGSPARIPVTLTVAEPDPPVLSASPASLSFAATAGGAAPAAQSIAVTNTGAGVLSFSATSDKSWLGVSPSGGTAPTSLAVTVNAAGLAAGSYSGSVTISAHGAGGAPKSIPVTLTVAPAAGGGLVGAWGFDETSGTTVGDASGKGNVGTISGATRTASGRFGGALTFNGTSNWVTVPSSSSLNLTTGMTLEGWAYPTANGSGSWRAMMVKEGATGLAWALYPFGDTGLPSGHAFTSSEQWARGTAAPALNTWTHFAATYDGSIIRLYVNGAQVATKAQTGSLLTSSQPLRFGGDSLWPEWFKGRLDELRVYNRALPANEIQADMTRPVSSATLLRAQAELKRSAKRRGASRVRRASSKPVQIKRYRARHRHGSRGKV